MHFDKYHHYANQDLRHSQLHGKFPQALSSQSPTFQQASNILIFYHLYLDLSVVKLAINRTILYVLSLDLFLICKWYFQLLAMSKYVTPRRASELILWLCITLSTPECPDVSLHSRNM